MTDRRTIVAHGRMAMRELRLDAARHRRHGLQIMSFEQLAARLAGGFSRPIDDESLRTAIQAVLPDTSLGELESIKLLPGMVDASADTLHKTWRASIDLASRSHEHPRLDSIARLEAAVLAQLPPGMMRPCDLVATACQRLAHAKAVLGPVEIVGITELSPCWRPLLAALTGCTPVTWTAGPRPTPPWLEATGVTIARDAPQAPEVRAESASTAYHEAIEAIRWARALLASGEAQPAEIAIAAASTAEYDDHFLSLRADANLDLHFIHGIKVTTTREGQAAAALADILVRGLSQTRLRRLAALCGSEAGPLQTLPAGWLRILPTEAPLASVSAWTRLLGRLSAPPATPLAPHLRAFHDATAAFSDFIQTAPAVEDETATFAERLAGMAQAMEDAATAETPAGLIRLLVTPPHPDLCTKSGSFLAFRKKGKWVEAAKREGLAKADGDRLNAAAEGHYAACCQAWQLLLQNVASHVLADLIAQAQPVLERFRDYKRSAALLDFDDLIFAARDLLRDHDEVRRALSARFTRVLVDEFQDTDPLQTEIFWRLCGEPPAGRATAEWSEFQIRPGALFLVGDPKQAIYRFRGADVSAYVRARDAFIAQDADSVLSISTNFRSCAPILTYVNERFETLLSSDGQPGFTALDPFHSNRGEAPCVAALDVTVADENGKASAEQQRDAEAEAVAELCARLIGSEIIIDRRSDASRVCRPGDIALLAPTGSDLWRYEEALERHGIPVATQAGKGLFRRQEIQDLIALTRILADRRDTLALGALLRGPLVGLTEEELLDIIWALPRSEEYPEALPRLDLGVETSAIAHPLARSVIEKLQVLNRRTNNTTPHNLLSQAVDVMRVRPMLLARHRGQAERALANVDLYLSLTSAFAVRGLRAFAETMTAAWTDEARAVEGRPDAQEEAVALYTMHAAKGLEWPIVVPVASRAPVSSRPRFKRS